MNDVGLFDEVLGQVRAVFGTLAEAVSAEEWFNVTAGLPAEYRGLLPGAFLLRMGTITGLCGAEPMPPHERLRWGVFRPDPAGWTSAGVKLTDPSQRRNGHLAWVSAL